MNSIFRYEERNGEIMITGLREGVTETSIVIPDTIGELPVTEIKRVAFYESSITDIKIGKNIKEIEPDAFSYSKSLKAVHWNTQTKSIPMDCFRRCSSLSEFDFSSVENIGAGAFEQSGLKEVNLSHNIQKVEGNAFYGCKSLKAVHWNAQTKDIPLCCVYECSSLKQFSFSDVEYLAVEALHTAV